VRARYSDPKGDIGRAERQRQFLGAVVKKAATPSTVLVPWRWWGFTHAAASAVLVGQDTGLVDAYRILSTMRAVSNDGALSLVVPISDPNATTSAGSSVLWDDKRAAELFTMLRDGTPLDAPPPGTDGTPG
jgi:anionic cell wall polymer biosynthesis LytR-Cps2A-Psr (LCP) family protein